AVQQQLGLKLESARGPIKILVIDHVERPTEN
ncbi:MAG: TIGR03435 family protein, partial [Acidobacteriia bacterium]|nr:TIGR03435 family protein [Terriglobia bacterium]